MFRLEPSGSRSRGNTFIRNARGTARLGIFVVAMVALVAVVLWLRAAVAQPSRDTDVGAPPAPSTPDLDNASDTGPLAGISKKVHLLPASDAQATGPLQYWLTGSTPTTAPGFPLVNEVFSNVTNNPAGGADGFVMYPSSGTTGRIVFGMQPLTLPSTAIVTSVSIISVNRPTGGTDVYARNPATGTAYNVGDVSTAYTNTTVLSVRPWDGKPWTVADVAALQLGWGVEGSADVAFLERFAADVQYIDFTAGGNPSSVKTAAAATGTVNGTWLQLNSIGFTAKIGTTFSATFSYTYTPGTSVYIAAACDQTLPDGGVFPLPQQTTTDFVANWGPFPEDKTNCHISFGSAFGPDTITSGTYTYDDGVVVTSAATSPYLFDNVTNDNTPSFSGTNDSTATRVDLYDGTTLVGSDTTVSSGTWNITASTLTNATHAMTVKAVDGTGTGPASPALSVLIDTVAPTTPSTPDLAAASDTGVSSTDNVTNVTSPVFNGTGSSDTVIVGLFDGSTRVGTDNAPAAGTTYTSSPINPVAAGAHSAGAQAWDLAGNASAMSSTLSVSIVQYLTSLRIDVAPSAHQSEAVMVGVSVLDETGQPTTSLSGTLTVSTDDPSGTHFPAGNTYVLDAALGETGHVFKLLFGHTGSHTITVSSPGVVSATSSPVSVLATQLTATAPATVIQNQYFQFLVGARDTATTRTVTLYEALATLSSSDAAVTFTATTNPYQFTCLCEKTHSFITQLGTVGLQTVTVTDEFGLTASAQVNVVAGTVPTSNAVLRLDRVSWHSPNISDLYLTIAPGPAVDVLNENACNLVYPTGAHLVPPYGALSVPLLGNNCGPFGVDENNVGGIFYSVGDGNVYYRPVDYYFYRYSDMMADHAAGHGAQMPPDSPTWGMIDPGDPIHTSSNINRVQQATSQVHSPSAGSQDPNQFFRVAPRAMVYSIDAYEKALIWSYAQIGEPALSRLATKPFEQWRLLTAGANQIAFDDLEYSCYAGPNQLHAPEIAYTRGYRTGRQTLSTALDIGSAPVGFCAAPNGAGPYPSNWQGYGDDPWGFSKFLQEDPLADFHNFLAADPVDAPSGAFQQSVTDFALGGLTPSLSLSRRYSGFVAEQQALGLDTTTSLFGQGWASNLDWSVVGPDADGTVVVHGLGGSMEFKADAGGTYRSLTLGVRYQLVTAGSGWKVTDESGLAGYQFDANGRLMNLFDSAGRQLTLTWVSGKLGSFSDPAGRTATVTTNAAGRITRVDLADGRNVLFTYDAAGRLATSRDMAGTVTTFVTDARGRIVAIKDDATPTPHTLLQNMYDSKGRVVQQIDALGNSTYFAYDVVPSNGALLLQSSAIAATVIVGPRGDTTTLCYTGAGLTAAKIDALDGRRTWVYDSAGDPVSSTDELGNVSKATYDASSHVFSATDALGHVVSMTWDSAGHPLTTTDAQGTTATVFNATTGLPTTVTRTDATHSLQVAAYGYDATTKLLTSSTAAGGGVSTVHYDARGYVDYIVDPEGRKTTFVTDARGFVTSSVDPLGNAAGGNPALHTTTWTYDAMGRVLTVTDPLGNAPGGTPAQHRMTYTYDSFGRRKTDTSPLGEVTTYTYNTNGQLITVVRKLTASVNATTGFEYDSEGHQTAIVDAESRRTETTYDLLGRPTAVKDPNLKSWLTQYDALGHVTKATDPTGRFSTTQYNAIGQKTKTTDPAGKDTIYAYDAVGQLQTITDPLSHATTLGYDWLGRQATSIDAKQQTWGVAFNDAGDVISSTNARNKTTSYLYNLDHQLTRVTEPGNAGNIVTQYAYDSGGRLHTRTNDRAAVETYDYDDLGRLIKVTDADLKTWQTFFDFDGNVDYTIDGKAQTTDFTNDLAGRILSLTPQTGAAITYTYDKTDRMLTMVDGNGTTTWGYDPDGRVTSVQRGSRTTGYAYDDAGRPTSVTYPSTLGSVGYAYDTAGRLATVTDWASRQTTYTYDNASRVATITRPGNLLTTIGYDELNRPLSVANTRNAANVLTLGYTYDADGNIATATDDTGQATFGYDNLDRLTSASYPSSQNYTYTYDNVGNTTQAVTPAGTSNYTYDLGDRITSVGPAGSAPGTSTRPPASNDSGWTNSANGYTSNNSYATAAPAQNATKTVNYGTFGFDSTVPSNATITAVTVTVEWKVSTTSSIATLGAQAVVSGTPVGTEFVNSAEPTSDTTQTFTVPGLTRSQLLNGTFLIRVRATRGNSGTAVTASLDLVSVKVDYTTPTSGTAPVYDGNGNMTSDGTYGNRTFTYDALGRLTGVTGAGLTATYTLDGLGNRWAQNVNGTATNFDLDLVSPNPTPLYDGTKKYLPGAAAAGYDSGGTWFSALPNQIGSPIEFVSQTGSTTTPVHYGPYGVPRTGSTNPMGIGFAGEWKDASGLINLRARAFDPMFARFLGRDTFGGTLSAPQSGNRYAYALLNPLRYTDPSGHFVDAFIKLAPTLVEFAFYSNPVTGLALAGFAAITGFDPITGQALDPNERVTNLALAVGLPIGGAILSKVGAELWDAYKAGRLDRAGLQLGDEAQAAQTLARDASIAERTEQGAARAGQIGYGSSDLSRIAIAARRDAGMLGARNVAVFEFRASSGLRTASAFSVRGVGHAERLLWQDLKTAGVKPWQVTRIYSELAPCSVPGGYCMAWIGRTFPQADVTWSFEYGADAASRARGLKELLAALGAK